MRSLHCPACWCGGSGVNGPPFRSELRTTALNPVTFGAVVSLVALLAGGCSGTNEEPVEGCLSGREVALESFIPFPEGWATPTAGWVGAGGILTFHPLQGVARLTSTGWRRVEGWKAVLSATPSGLIVHVEGAILSLTEAGDSARMPLPAFGLDDGLSTAVLSAPDRFWVVRGGTEETSIHLLGPNGSYQQTMTIPGNRRVYAIGGGDVAMWTAAPKDGVTILTVPSGQLRTLHLSPATLRELPEKAVTTSIVRTQDGCLLQTVGDLQSDRRWMVPFLGESPETAPISFTAPLSFFAYDRAEGTFLGFSDHPEQRGLVRYR